MATVAQPTCEKDFYPLLLSILLYLRLTLLEVLSIPTTNINWAMTSVQHKLMCTKVRRVGRDLIIRKLQLYCQYRNEIGKYACMALLTKQFFEQLTYTHSLSLQQSMYTTLYLNKARITTVASRATSDTEVPTYVITSSTLLCTSPFNN